MTKTLLLLEDPEKIDRIILEGARITGQSVNISLTPGASYAFERSNIPSASIRDYGGGEVRYQQGLENFQRIERIVTILDKELAHLHTIPSLTPARYSIYNLKILFDVLWSTIHILKRIIEKEQPDLICLYTSPQFKSDERIYAFSNDESVFAEVLNMPGWNVPVEIIRNPDSDIPDQRIGGQKNTTFSWLPAWIKEQDLIFNLGLMGKREGIFPAAAALYYYITCRHRRPVLIYNSGYNWDDSLVELYKGGMVPVYRIRDEIVNEVISPDNTYNKEVRTVCSTHPGMREFDQILDIDVSAFFFERLSQIIGRSMQESIALYPRARRIIKKKKIRCLLHSVRERAIGHAVVQAAHDAGIPVVSWQHGGAGYYYHPIMPFIEFIKSDWHFVFGEGVARSYLSTSESVGLEKNPVFIPVGSSSLDVFYRHEKRPVRERTGKTVVYVSTHYLQNIYIISQIHDPAGWNEDLWDVQKAVLNLAKKNPCTEFIIKLHPVHKDKEPLQRYATDQGIKNITIITTEMSVRELTDIADVMIFDLISTGILQVLTSDLPVFVYANLHAIDPDPLMQLMKRVYLSRDKDQFVVMIQQYLDTQTVERNERVDLKDTEFLMNYGTDRFHHQSNVNAVTNLKRILLYEHKFPQEC